MAARVVVTFDPVGRRLQTLESAARSQQQQRFLVRRRTALRTQIRAAIDQGIVAPFRLNRGPEHRVRDPGEDLSRTSRRTGTSSPTRESCPVGPRPSHRVPGTGFAVRR